MNITQALTRVRARLGKRAVILDSKRATSPEKRAATAAMYLAAKTIKEAADEALQLRKQAILSADAEYQRLLSERSSAADALAVLSMGTHDFRYDAGVDSTLFFRVVASADTLAELVDKVDAQTAKVTQ